MKRFDRQRFLRMAAWTGAGAAIGGLGVLPVAGGPESFFLITSDPDRDRERLLRITGPSRGAAVDVQLIQPAGQDLGLILNGRLVNPVQNRACNGLRDMAYELRRRSEQGCYFVTISAGNQGPSDEIVIEVDGRVVRRVGMNETDTKIVVPGMYGQTVFSLRDGALAVTKFSCRHGLCRKLGWVRTGRIVCAPNRLVASIGRNGAGLDALTG